MDAGTATIALKPERSVARIEAAESPCVATTPSTTPALPVDA
jgi:hypothetical protein